MFLPPTAAGPRRSSLYPRTRGSRKAREGAYNCKSFFVRHAYFTGAEEPYEKLKRALRAELDESAWFSQYSTTSRPFDRPTSGKIAVKVINHYGDEVLKVFEV